MQARLARLATGPPDAQVPAAEASSAERLLAVIALRYTEELTVDEIARAAAVHPTYAAHAFRQTLGMPIWRYVTHLRVAHACRLLAGTGWGVERVAHASGFQTRSSFYRTFRAVVGRTPVQYRASMNAPSSEAAGFG
jgi:AraC-like DNA-binding protein